MKNCFRFCLNIFKKKKKTSFISQTMQKILLDLLPSRRIPQKHTEVRTDRRENWQLVNWGNYCEQWLQFSSDRVPGTWQTTHTSLLFQALTSQNFENYLWWSESLWMFQLGSKTECALLGLILDLGKSYEDIRKEHPEESLVKVGSYFPKSWTNLDIFACNICTDQKKHCRFILSTRSENQWWLLLNGHLVAIEYMRKEPRRLF